MYEKISQGRVGIVTDLGSSGFAPRDVLPGDLVVVFFGARTPFIFRMIAGGLESPEYELMGDCYVQGLMYGEAGDCDSHPAREFTIC